MGKKELRLFTLRNPVDKSPINVYTDTYKQQKPMRSDDRQKKTCNDTNCKRKDLLTFNN